MDPIREWGCWILTWGYGGCWFWTCNLWCNRQNWVFNTIWWGLKKGFNDLMVSVAIEFYSALWKDNDGRRSGDKLRQCVGGTNWGRNEAKQERVGDYRQCGLWSQVYQRGNRNSNVSKDQQQDVMNKIQKLPITQTTVLEVKKTLIAANHQYMLKSLEFSPDGLSFFTTYVDYFF